MAPRFAFVGLLRALAQEILCRPLKRTRVIYCLTPALTACPERSRRVSGYLHSAAARLKLGLDQVIAHPSEATRNAWIL